VVKAELNYRRNFLTEKLSLVKLSKREIIMANTRKKGVLRNPNAVALGALGNKKGGDARAAKLSPKQRSRIASKGGIAKNK